MSKPWYRSKVFLAAAAVVAVVLVALLVVPYFLNIERYRPMIVEQMKLATGREVEIGGLGLSFLPTTHLTVRDLRIKNPKGFPEGDTIAVEAIDIGLALRPLLSRRVEVTSVSVNGVQANLLSNERGENNYDSLFESKASTGKPGSGAPAVSLGKIGSVAVREVKVYTGSFWRQNRRVYPGWQVQGVDADLSGLDLSAANLFDNASGSIDLDGVQISGPGWKQPLAFTDGAVEVKGKTADGKFSAELGALRARGTLKVTDLLKPVADFTLSVKELNLAELAGAMGSSPRGAPRAPGRGKLLARGSAKIERLVAAPLTANNVEARLRVYDNRLEADPFTLSLYGGGAQGSLGVDLASDSLPARVNANLRGVKVEQMLKALSPDSKRKITGTLGGSARLAVPLGASNPMAALGGEGQFAVTDGVFPGLDLRGAFGQLVKLMQINLPSGDVPISFFGGDFRVSGARIHNNELRLDSDALQATLRGSVGFDQTLSYSGTGILKGQASTTQQTSNPVQALGGLFGRVMQETTRATRMGIPFTVRGTLQDPKVLPGGAPQPVR